MKKILLAAITAAMILIPTTSASATNDKPVLCHATGSASNPWVKIQPDSNSYDAHEAHGDVFANEDGLCPGEFDPNQPTDTDTIYQKVEIAFCVEVNGDFRKLVSTLKLKGEAGTVLVSENGIFDLNHDDDKVDQFVIAVSALETTLVTEGESLEVSVTDLATGNDVVLSLGYYELESFSYSKGLQLTDEPCEPGPAGPAGQDGQDGTDGTDGVDGVDGIDGVDGEDGVNGVANLDEVKALINSAVNDAHNRITVLEGRIKAVNCDMLGGDNFPTVAGFEHLDGDNDGISCETDNSGPAPTAPVSPATDLPRTGSSVVWLAGLGALALAMGLGLRFFRTSAN